MIIRPARPADCADMSAVRTASITRLCAPDHDGDPERIAGWANKTPAERFRQLIEDPNVDLMVAEREGRIVAIGGLTADRITLNYVHPDYRFMGISKAMMAALETALKAKGVDIGRLDSTMTALPFYRAIGWENDGSHTPDMHQQGYPMRKMLSG